MKFLPGSLVWLVLALGCLAARADAPALADGFQNPPQSAQPETWWHWMNGNISKEGITADLEAMKRVGIRRATIVNTNSEIPPGPVTFLTPEWHSMLIHAASEAQRLGMKLAIENCAGWSSSGGPWITPDHAMQAVTSAETVIPGGAHYSGILKQPSCYTKANYYRDIAVLAFPRTPGEAQGDVVPEASSNAPGFDGTKVTDHDRNTQVDIPLPQDGQPYWIELKYPAPITARTLIFNRGWGENEGKADIQVSDDGTNFRTIQTFGFKMPYFGPLLFPLGPAPVTSRYFRIVFTKGGKFATKFTVADLALSPRLSIGNLETKGGFPDSDYETLQADPEVSYTPDEVVTHAGIIDLTARMGPDGRLDWDAPPGNWTVLRIGYTLTGAINHPDLPGGNGLECDKLSRDGLDQHWPGLMQKALDDTQPFPGVLSGTLIDSYEVGGQNWTPAFREEFRKRRGYDLLPFLPVLGGRVVDSPEVSERFLWDMRRTIADLFADNYYSYFTDLAHKAGLESMIEPYDGPYEGMQCGNAPDEVMGEFWSGSSWVSPSVRMAAAVAHTYGKGIVGAESFSGSDQHASWSDDPYALKPWGDAEFCAGLNRVTFHRYAHQPWIDWKPGMTMGKWGNNFERTNTWWEQGRAWMQYLARCQYLLQQGLYVADICYLAGEQVPQTSHTFPVVIPPRGYASDVCNEDVLLNRMTVKDGRIVLPDGMSYRLLVLPDSTMALPVLQKISDLVRAGATVVGPKPTQTPGLADYPNADRQLQALAAASWGPCDGTRVKENALGSGRIVWGEDLAQILGQAGVPPDFSCPANFLFIHRTVGDADIYFISNQKNQAASVTCTFRISGKTPQLWRADTGGMETAPVYNEHGGRTDIPITLDPAGSVFVVFRPPSGPANHLVAELNPDSANRLATEGDQVKLLAAKPGSYAFKTAGGASISVNVDAVPASQEVSGPWEVAFPPHLGAPDHISLDHLISWPAYELDGVKYFSGTATYRKQLLLSASLLQPGLRLFLDLGKVKNLAELKLNGQDLGILWKPPFRVEITGQAREGENDLEIQVTNLWQNRLIGDEQLPEDVEWVPSGNEARLKEWPQWFLNGIPRPSADRITFTTWRHLTKDSPLDESGLIGPVMLQPVREVAVPSQP